MVGVIEELEILVVVGVFERLGNCATLSLPHCFGLCSLQCAVVAAEALAIDIVVVVLAIVRHCKGSIIILNDLQLLGIFSLIINRQAISLATCILDAVWVCLLCSPIYAAFLILLQILSYSLIVYGYQLYNAVLSCLLLTAFNTHIRVMTNTLIWLLGHTFIWISSNNLYMVYHSLIVLMLYILSFIAVMAWRLCATLVVLFILTVPDLEYYALSLHRLLLDYPINLYIYNLQHTL